MKRNLKEVVFMVMLDVRAVVIGVVMMRVKMVVMGGKYNRRR